MLKVEAPGGVGEILLHACCAPCSGAVLECLRDSGIRPVVFFSNSNIAPRAEYELRLSELRRYTDLLGVELVEDEYDHGAWLSAVRGLEDEPERGRRCEACFRFRLRRAAQYAASRGLPVLATTLASSRWKDLDQVNAAGCEAVAATASGNTATLGTLRGGTASEAQRWGPTQEDVSGGSWPLPSPNDVVFWPQNWRKGGLQERRNEVIREQGFYNQTWCGCEFSRKQNPLNQ